MIDGIPSLRIAATVDDLKGYQQMTDPICGGNTEIIRSVASTLCSNGADVIASVDTREWVTFWRRRSECEDSDTYQRRMVTEKRYRNKRTVDVYNVTASGIDRNG